MSDIEMRCLGSIWLMVALTSGGQYWIDENVGEDTTRSGTGVVIEARYVEDIVLGARADGLEVSGVMEGTGFDPVD